MRYSDFTPGRIFELGPAALAEDEIVEFARRYDPQPFHVDRAAAAHGPWNGVIASGWQTCAVAMRLAVDHLLKGSETFGSPGLACLRWANPVRPGDALTVRITVLEQRMSASKPSLGIVRWRWVVTNQRDEPVLDLEATNLFDLAAKP